MFRTQRFIQRVFVLLIITALIVIVIPATAQRQPIEHLIPIGGGYSDIYTGFAQAAVANARNKQVKILVLPFASASDPVTITDSERADLLKVAEERRFQIEEACKRAAPKTVTCVATLAPILTHSDAENPAARAAFTDDLSAIFILNGDPTIGMSVILGTPIEMALGNAYNNNVIVAGTGAGGSLQSTALLAGYRQNFTADKALDFGAVDVWNTAGKHGLAFSIKNAIVDSHFYRNNHVGRLLNAVTLPNVPHVGIGLDEYTGVNVYDETRLQDVFGLYVTTILDAETYHAADAVQYRGPNNTLSLRNVLVQLLAPGKFSYDLNKRAMSIGARAQTPPAKVTRDFKMLALPQNAGPLLLAGDLSEALGNNAILKRFVELAGGEKAQVLIVAAGYPSENLARTSAEKYAAALGVPAQIIVVSDQSTPLVVPQNVTGILLIAEDQSKVKAPLLQPIKSAWLNGLPLLADNGGAAVTGKFYSAHGPTPDDPGEAELAVQKSFLQRTTQIAAGLGLLDVTIEPQVINDNRWGRLFSLAYNQLQLPSFGLTQNSALEITRDGAKAIGDEPLIALDLRKAVRDRGTNNGFVIANGLLDVFAPGDGVTPAVADVNAAPTRVPTPVLPTNTPTATSIAEPTAAPTQVSAPSLTPTMTASATPTVTPLPTATPLATPTASAPQPSPELPFVPIAIGAFIVFFAIVLVAGRRRK